MIRLYTHYRGPLYSLLYLHLDYHHILEFFLHRDIQLQPFLNIIHKDNIIAYAKEIIFRQLEFIMSPYYHIWSINIELRYAVCGEVPVRIIIWSQNWADF